MVEETVEHGGSDGAITVEDGSPLFEGFVGGKDDRSAFVASQTPSKSARAERFKCRKGRLLNELNAKSGDRLNGLPVQLVERMRSRKLTRR